MITYLHSYFFHGTDKMIVLDNKMDQNEETHCGIWWNKVSKGEKNKYEQATSDCCFYKVYQDMLRPAFCLPCENTCSEKDWIPYRLSLWNKESLDHKWGFSMA